MYQTSKNYERLWELAMSGERIFCVVDSRWNGETIRSLAECSQYEQMISIGALGVTFVLAMGEARKEKFIADCKRKNVEFIDPASQRGGDALWHSTDMLRDALKRMKPGGGLYRSIEEQIAENEKARGES